MLVQGIQDGLEAAFVAELVHELEEAGADARADARYEIDLVVALFWLHEVIKLLIAVLFILRDLVHTAQVNLHTWRVDRDVLVVLGGPAVENAAFIRPQLFPL